MVRSDGRSKGDGRAADGGLREALGRVGDRWTLLLVSALLDGPRRFNELQGDVGGIAPNVLSQRLRQLEADRLVVAHPYSERPLRHAYELTATGAELAGALRLLASWGAEHGDSDPIVHAACGSATEARWWCPTCDRMVADDELDELRWI
ncbi:MAG TPA: helix-turn-helix domain-containing protein [Acidimicrobiales bacterium]|jgi:DNA-binding HxlR family transcriptional regulator